jgi:hypothetical protein
MVKKIKKSTAYQRFMRYVVDRLGEASTLRGLVVIAATGICQLTPEHIEQVVLIAGLLVGGMGAALPDAPKKKVNAAPAEQEQE